MDTVPNQDLTTDRNSVEWGIAGVLSVSWAGSMSNEIIVN